jgi:hypothetical protein
MEHLVRSHVERCLQDIWQVCQVRVDADGDYPFRAGVASCWVRVDSELPVLVRVFGHAAVDVRRFAGLLRELNDVNCRARSTSVVWDPADSTPGRGVVRVAAMIHPEALGRRSLRHALDAVAVVSNDLGPLVASVYGGTTPFAAQTAEEG